MGHSRLSILDLSVNGNQPMHSPSSRYVMVFNGEIYNYGEIKASLIRMGYQFLSTSDSEVAVAAFEEYGIEAAVKMFVGMFAFAVFDKESSCIHLIRDRLGIKPLYYNVENNILVFASELKAIRASGLCSLELNFEVMCSYLRYGYVPQPYSIYDDTRQVKPGTIATIKLGKGSLNYEESLYWSPETNAALEMSQNDYLDSLHEVLRDAVRVRLNSDVPLGILLSGGIDSSLMAAIARDVADKPINTFCIGFDDTFYNEADKAKKIASYLGTNHNELFITEKNAIDIVPILGSIYDEPFADPSAVPTLLLSKFVKSHVSVALSGDGGDELFCGYSHYFSAQKLFALRDKLPRFAVYMLKGLLTCSPDGVIDAMWGGYKNNKNFGVYPKSYARRLKELTRMLDIGELKDIYKLKNSILPSYERLLLSSAREVETPMDDECFWRYKNIFESMMRIDRDLYLPSDILTKIDRASMHYALEVRVPILDHRVVELSDNIPVDFKYDINTGKTPLRNILGRYVPENLYEQKKAGFGVPVEAWLKGPLKEWAYDMLSRESVEKAELLNWGSVNELINDFEENRLVNPRALWNIVMLQAWRLDDMSWRVD